MPKDSGINRQLICSLEQCQKHVSRTLPIRPLNLLVTIWHSKVHKGNKPSKIQHDKQEQ